MTDTPEDRPRMARPRRPYPIADSVAGDIDRTFRIPALGALDAAAAQLVAAKLREASRIVAANVPKGNDQNAALKNLREAWGWSLVGIAKAGPEALTLEELAEAEAEASLRKADAL